MKIVLGVYTDNPNLDCACAVVDLTPQRIADLKKVMHKAEELRADNEQMSEIRYFDYSAVFYPEDFYDACKETAGDDWLQGRWDYLPNEIDSGKFEPLRTSYVELIVTTLHSQAMIFWSGAIKHCELTCETEQLTFDDLDLPLKQQDEDAEIPATA